MDLPRQLSGFTSMLVSTDPELQQWENMIWYTMEYIVDSWWSFLRPYCEFFCEKIRRPYRVHRTLRARNAEKVSLGQDPQKSRKRLGNSLKTLHTFWRLSGLFPREIRDFLVVPGPEALGDIFETFRLASEKPPKFWVSPFRRGFFAAQTLGACLFVWGGGGSRSPKHQELFRHRPLQTCPECWVDSGAAAPAPLLFLDSCVTKTVATFLSSSEDMPTPCTHVPPSGQFNCFAMDWRTYFLPWGPSRRPDSYFTQISGRNFLPEFVERCILSLPISKLSGEKRARR